MNLAKVRKITALVACCWAGMTGCGRGAAAGTAGRAAGPEITVTWCNFTDTYARRTVQGPTGGHTSITSAWSQDSAVVGLPTLATSDIQERLESKLGIPFEALGGPESIAMVKLIELFGTPGAPRLPDSGPPAAVDQEPDVFPYGYWCTGSPHNEVFIQAVCAGLSEQEVRTWMPGMARAIENVATHLGGVQKAWDLFKVAGRITWLPLNIEESLGDTVDTPEGILWRADLLEELGLGVPRTIQDWDRAFEEYHRRYPNKVVWSDDRNFWSWRSVYTATGVPYGNWFMEDGRASPWWVRPEVRRALETLQAWYRKGYLDTREPTAIGPSAFVSGDSIVADLVEWDAGNWVLEEPYIAGSLPYQTRELNPRARFVLSPPPVYEGVAAVRLPLAHRNVLWGAFAFAKRLESDRDKLHRIMAAIDRIASDRDTFLLAYHGVEGRDWVWDKSGGQDYPKLLLSDAQREKAGLGRYWTQALYGSFLEYRVDPRVLRSRSELTSGPGGLYGEQVNRWNQDVRALVSPRDVSVHQRLYEKETALYQEFEKVQERIVRRGEPLTLFDDYLLYWREHGGPDLEAEVTRLIDKTQLR